MRKYIGIGVAAITFNLHTFLTPTVPPSPDLNLEKVDTVISEPLLTEPDKREATVLTIPFPKPTPPKPAPVKVASPTVQPPTITASVTTPSSAIDIKTYLHNTVNSAWIPWFEAVINCESRWNPNARNASGASGLMQFMPATFYGNGGKNIWDWRDQINTAYRMVQKNPGSKYLWSCSKLMGF